MLLPLDGLRLIGIPLAGFIAGIWFYSFKRLRFFVALAISTPMCTSYSGCVGFWSVAIGLEKLGVRSETAKSFRFARVPRLRVPWRSDWLVGRPFNQSTPPIVVLPRGSYVYWVSMASVESAHAIVLPRVSET
jgi:hypothetical protein